LNLGLHKEIKMPEENQQGSERAMQDARVAEAKARERAAEPRTTPTPEPRTPKEPTEPKGR
jgi:hypothetical protein